MEEKKYLGMSKNVFLCLTWVLTAVLGLGWITALIVFLQDREGMDVEFKRELVSVFVAAIACLVLSCTFIVPIYVFICSIIAAVKAYKGGTFKIPGVYQIAAAIIK